MHRVVVTGMGALSPLGQGVDTYWEGLLAGRSAASPISGFDASEFATRIACEVPEFEPGEALDRKDAKRMDRFCVLGMVAAHEALQDSGILDAAAPEDLGCIVGVGIGGLTELETQIERYFSGGNTRVSPLFIPKLMPNAISGNISIRWNILGPTFTVNSACASAAHSMGLAHKAVALGEAKAVITGGAESTVRPSAIAGFQNMKALSRRNEEPQRASRPFDTDRDGFVMGEGSGMLIFEELEHAKKRGATIYAEVLGSGFTSDALNISSPSTDGSGPARAMEMSLKALKVDHQRVSYINAHGTSTPLGDISEIKAIKRLFGDHSENIKVSSTKSMVGHLLGASGGVELIAAVMSCHTGKIHPTINVDNQDPECDLNVVPNQAIEVDVDVAISNSFGFGGHNASVAVCRFK